MFVFSVFLWYLSVRWFINLHTQSTSDYEVMSLYRREKNPSFWSFCWRILFPICLHEWFPQGSMSNAREGRQLKGFLASCRTNELVARVLKLQCSPRPHYFCSNTEYTGSSSQCLHGVADTCRYNEERRHVHDREIAIWILMLSQVLELYSRNEGTSKQGNDVKASMCRVCRAKHRTHLNIRPPSFGKFCRFF